ncbi:MAG TPA: NUDIX hydrolase [Gammaproteobacteria bacterium]|nr:NUDIX hydrolase [Gammaproteobacteria bacterium]|tara:strand:- start:486 stop:1160 length:675 start_codon:yes stop_codon:yes gene_type:complete
MSIVPAIPSSAVIITRDASNSSQVLLVRRNKRIAFHGGSWVFPGGKVDAVDYGAEDVDELTIARRAAVREVAEETALTVCESHLECFSHWTTPENQPKRFATWFFLTQVASDNTVEVDGSEIVEHQWLSIGDALRKRANNEIILPPPTFVSLVKLQRFTESNHSFDCLGSQDVERFVPRLVELENGRCSLYEEDAGYKTLDLTAEGAQHRLFMLDSGWHYVRDF